MRSGLLAALVLTAGVLAGLPSGPAVAQTAAEAGQGAAVRADLSSGSLVVPVVINGQTTDAVLDTGASHTVIDVRLAEALGIRAEGAVSVGGAAQAVRGGRGGPVRISVGASSYEARPLLIDLGPTGLEQKVIVGRDFFDSHIVAIDFAEPGIRMLHAAEAAAIEGEPVSLSATTTAILSLPLTIGGTTYEGALDLGSQTALAVPPAVAEALEAEGRPGSTWVRGDISGWSVIATTTAPEIRMAGTTLRHVPAVVDADPSRAGSVTVGLPVLRRFSIVLDLGHRRMWLTPGAGDSGRPFSRDRSGLAMTREADGLQIVHVARGSPAERAGFQTGEFVVAVDAQDVTADSAARLARAGYAEPGTRVSLRTADGVTRTIVLEDYY